MKRAGRCLFAITGILACPCHLPLTLAAILSVFGGGALGAFLAKHTVIFYVLFSAWFVGGLYVGYRLLERRGQKGQGQACEVGPGARLNDPTQEGR